MDNRERGLDRDRARVRPLVHSKDGPKVARVVRMPRQRELFASLVVFVFIALAATRCASNDDPAGRESETALSMPVLFKMLPDSGTETAKNDGGVISTMPKTPEPIDAGKNDAGKNDAEALAPAPMMPDPMMPDPPQMRCAGPFTCTATGTGRPCTGTFDCIAHCTDARCVIQDYRPNDAYCHGDQWCVKRCSPSAPICMLPYGGMGSVPCSDANDCLKRCDLNNPGQCVVGGSGAYCTPTQEGTTQSDTCFSRRCQADRCVLGGAGLPCGANADCQTARCLGASCVRGGSGRPCTANTDCTNVRTCDGLTCRAGLYSNISCTADADCSSIGNGRSCSSEGRCDAVGRTDTPCRVTEDCARIRVCSNRRCVGTSNIMSRARRCNVDADCNGMEPRCEGWACVIGGNSNISCDPMLNQPIGDGNNFNRGCVHKVCFSVGGRRECRPVEGAGPYMCNDDDDCRPRRPPGCVPPGGGMTSLLDNGETETSTTCAAEEPSEEVEPDPSRISSVASEAIVASASLWDENKVPVEETKQKLAVDNASRGSLGKRNAPLTIVFFQDLTCGMCKHAYREIVAGLRTEHVKDGAARIVFAEFPLFGANSTDGKVGAAALCAKETGEYFAFLDFVYGSSEHDGERLIAGYAAKLGKRAAPFNRCVASDRYRAQVERDVALGKSLGVVGTPTIFINGRIVKNTRYFSEFKAALDDAMLPLAKPKLPPVKDRSRSDRSP